MTTQEPCWSLVAYVTGADYLPKRLLVLRHGITSAQGLDYIHTYRQTFEYCVLEIGLTKHFVK